MRHCAIACLFVGLVTMAGCSRQQPSPCEPDRRYATARSSQPVQIPDDLSPPDENDALRLPPPAGSADGVTAGECLEAPPSFFGESRPFALEEDAAGEPSRRARREARREERREARGESREDGAPAPPAEPADAPQGDDRVIDN